MRSKVGQSFIDHISVENKNREAVSAFEILHYGASDHELVFINIDVNTTKAEIQRKKTIGSSMAACSTTPVLNSFLQNFMIPADGENVYIIDW